MAGRLGAARRLAERLRDERPADPRVLTLLGRVHLAWPVVGRYRAESLFTRAGELDPTNPEPFYYLGRVGLELSGDDGEMIARRGLGRVLALDPNYRDAFALWSTLYRADRERRAMVDALARHAGNGAADRWRAGLLIELMRYDEAVPLLAALAALSPEDPAPHALLAQLLHEQGRDDEGARAYEAALRRAARDTAELLWRQVRSIATPAEREAYARSGAAGREAFLRLFWASREPDLRSPGNERVGEHFRRLAEARRVFSLLHPQSRYHHSRAWRTLAGGLGPVPGVDLDGIAGRIAETRLARVGDEQVAAGLVGRLDSEGEESANLEDGLDDRGRIYVRYGEPDERYVWNGDAETWRYDLPQGLLQVSFARRTGGAGLSGDQVVTPVVAGEYVAARYLLETDRPDVPATLRFNFRPAAFALVPGELTEVVVFAEAAATAAVLLDGEGREAARDSAGGRALRLVAPPGRYLLALDARRDRELGRFRGAVALPRFGADSLAVSDILVASGDVTPERTALVAAAPPALRLRAESPMRFYAELYGLGSEEGRSRYQAEYHFERARGGLSRLLARRHHTSFSFGRDRPAEPITIESLVMDPGRLPAGRYRLTLAIRDLVRGGRAAGASLEFELR